MANRGPYFYDTSIVWREKRRGEASSPGLPPLSFSTPPEFSGEAGFWSPEHLYVLSAETCLMATFVAIAEISKLAVRAYSSSAKGKLEWVEGEGLKFTEIELRPLVEVEKEADRERALRLMEKAEKNCLIGRSMNTRLVVHPEVRAVATAA